MLGQSIDWNGDDDDLPDGPSEDFVLTISDHWIGGSDGKLRVFADHVFWAR